MYEAMFRSLLLFSYVTLSRHSKREDESSSMNF